MKTLLIILSAFLFSFTIKAQPDKTKHFYAGFGIAIISGEICNQIIDRPAISSLVGTTLGCLAGIGKESIYDKAMHKGVCDNNDAYMTFWGSICGGMVIRVRFDLQEKRKEKEKINYSFNDLN